MPSERSFVCKLAGFSDSNPEIVTIFPQLDLPTKESSRIIKHCLPEGCKDGDLKVLKYGKSHIISYIFRNPQVNERDDLISYSILLNEKEKPIFLKKIIEELFETLKVNNLLKERIIIENLENIYNGLNNETDIEIKGIKIKISQLFEKFKKDEKDSKPKLKGSFF